MSKKSSLPRGGLPPPTIAWYQNLTPSNTTPQPFTTYRDSQLYLGFNMTPNQFAVIEDRIMELLQVNDLYNEAPSAYSTYVAHWGIFEVLGNEFPCLFKEDVPGWWALDALRGWIKKAASWMKAHEGEVKSRRLFNKSHWEGPPQKKIKASNMVLFKHCHFMITVREEAGKATIVPLVDLLGGGKGVDDGAPDLQAWDLQVMRLFGALARDLEFGALDTLVYTITGVGGEKIDAVVGNDGDLRNAVVCLRTPGRSVMYMEVIRAVVEFSPKENLNQYQSSPSSDTYNLNPEDDSLQRAKPVPPEPRLLTVSSVKEEPDLQPQVPLDAVPERIPSFDENIYDAESDTEDIIEVAGSDNDSTSSKNHYMFTEPTIKQEPDLRTPTPLLYDPERSFPDDEVSYSGDNVNIETSRFGSFNDQCPQRMFSYEPPSMQGELSPVRVSNLEYDPERSFNTNHNIDMDDNLDSQTNGSAIQYHNQRMTPDMPTVKEELSPLREVNIKHGLEMSLNTDVSAYGAESVDDEIAGLVGPVVKRPKVRLKVRKRVKKERSSAPRSPDVVSIFPEEFYRAEGRPAESVDDEIAGLVEPFVNCPPSPRSSRSRKRRSLRR